MAENVKHLSRISGNAGSDDVNAPDDTVERAGYAAVNRRSS